jgi:hypothetical protein
MQTLTQLAGAVSAPVLPVECLEKIVENNTVFGLLVQEIVLNGFGREYVYEGFYSSRQQAEKRAFFIYSAVADAYISEADLQPGHQEYECQKLFMGWLKNPSDEKKHNLLAASECAKIVDVLLSPTHPIDKLFVYFDKYVTNIQRQEWNNPIDCTEYLLDDPHKDYSDQMYDWFVDCIEGDEKLETLPGFKEVKRIAEQYGVVWKQPLEQESEPLPTNSEQETAGKYTEHCMEEKFHDLKIDYLQR